MKPHHPGVLEYEARMDALPLRTSCTLCPWVFEGSALDGREKAAQHRSLSHPELVFKRKRPGTNLKSFRQPHLNKAEWKEVYEERDKRAKLLGIDLPASES